jgi:hypothetical protein
LIKYYSTTRNNKLYWKDTVATIAHGAAVGDKNNENLTTCWTCKKNGFPHEAIDFRKISSGRTRNDGTFEYQKYELLNYFTGRKHEHRQQQQQQQQTQTQKDEIK